MPGSSGEILRRLGVAHAPAALRLETDSHWQTDGQRTLLQGPLLWPRLEEPPTPSVSVTTKETIVTDQPSTPNPTAPAAAPAPTAAPADNRITIDEFMKIDLRVAKVTAAERVPKADKLLKLTLDVGGDLRTVVSGIAPAYAPEQMVGKTVIYLANLAPRKIRGVLSQGMILAAGGDEVLALSGLDRDVPPGTPIR
jgi:methionyl-tRNA synthetase